MNTLSNIATGKIRQLMAIMFTDIVGYTAMMQQDEKKGKNIRGKHREIFSRLTAKHGGKILQYFGDGTLSVFNSSINAVRCAIEIQKESNKSPVIPLRVGIHTGDIIYRNEEVLGDSVNVASRIESIAELGSIFISAEVYDDIKNQADVKTRRLGTTVFKNVKEPITVYAINNEGLMVPDRVKKSYGNFDRFRYHIRSPLQDFLFFIGRNEELAEIRASLKLIEKYRPGVLVVSGTAGVGKSTLIQQGLSGVDAVVIETKVFEHVSTAFGPIINALRFLLNNVLFKCRDKLSLLEHLGLILTELKKKDLDTDNSTLIAAIQEVFWHAAMQVPVILFIEDIQWADTATIDLLPKLMDLPEDLPLLLLISNRSDHSLKNQKLRWLKSELRRCKSYKEINIKPFGINETSSMLATSFGKLPSKNLLEIIYEKTYGLPLFIEEIIKTLKTGNLVTERDNEMILKPDAEIPLPDSISDTVAIQLDNVTSEAREILELAATIGMEFEFDLLYEIDPNGAAIDELLDKQFFIETHMGKGSFRHALFLEAIRKDILWSKRKKINFKVAVALDQRKAAPEVVSEFWLKAGEKEKARVAYMEAARNYCNIHAYHDAVKLADKALELWPKGKEEYDRMHVLMQYANCARMSGQINESILAVREILGNPLIKDQYNEQANLHRSLASSYAMKSQWHHYKKSRESAAIANEKAGNWDEASIDWRELASHYSDELNYSASLKYIDHSIKSGKESGNADLLVRALSSKSYTLSLKGDVDKGLKLANEALQIAQSGNLIEATAYAYRKLAGVLEYSSKFNESKNTYESSLAFCRREDLSLQSLFCLSCMSWVMFRLGDFSAAVETCRDVIDDIKVNDASRSSAYLVIGLIEAYRGNIKSAYKSIEKSNKIASQINYKLMILLNLWGKATTLEFDNKFEESSLHYQQLISYWQESEDRHDVLGGICAAVSFFAEHQQFEDLSKCVSVSAMIAEETGNPEAIGVLSYSLGMSAFAYDKLEEAKANFENALNLFKELEIPLQVIMAQYQLGMVDILLGRRDEGVTVLKQAYLSSKNLGTRPLSSRIENILIGCGEVATDRRKTDHSTRKTHAGLTSRQFEILKALSKGLSNKEIASELFLSTRTVDMHVRNIFNTLNCRNRTDAVKVAVDLGIL
jgi:class 3 adenylate cyclase/DNA-binding CsgD family transcriptional regulator